MATLMTLSVENLEFAIKNQDCPIQKLGYDQGFDNNKLYVVTIKSGDFVCTCNLA